MNKWSLVIAVVGVLLSLSSAVVSAAYFVGGLDERVKKLEEQGISGALGSALGAISDKREKALKVLRTSLPRSAVMAVYATPGNLPQGWVICGEKGTPTIHNRFLLGTTTLADVGKAAGSPDHSHHMSATIRGESKGEHRAGQAGTSADFADNIHKGVGETGPRNWYHEHQVTAQTDSDNSFPPHIKVLFLCRFPGS